MHDKLQAENSGQQPEGRQFPIAIAAAVAVAALVLLGVYFWQARDSVSTSPAREGRAGFGPAEQAYASKLRIENLALSRAENFLHQEVTTLAGDLTNAGDRAVRGVELTAEFSDELQQVVLREARPAVAASAPPLGAGERRGFEISFEHIPASWNMQQPIVRVSGLQFATKQ